MSFASEVDKIAEIVKEKNAAYGNSFVTSGAALRLLYPNGISPDQYEDALLLVRIWDKMQRIATDNDAFGESPFTDIAGYGMCGSTRKTERTSDEELDHYATPLHGPCVSGTSPTCGCTVEEIRLDCPIHGD